MRNKMKKSDIFWQTYLNLEKELLEVSKYIYVTDENKSQLDIFSPHIADLIIRACIEIEAISKELYFDFDGEKVRGDKNLFFDEDCLKLIDIKCKTHKKVVMVTCPFFNLTKDENKFFRPLKEAHKRQGTDWEKAYQALKHDRYTSLDRGTVKNLIHAMGALYLLNIYYRDIKLYTKFLEVSKLDLSLGSSIFSVKQPDQNNVARIINYEDLTDILESGDSPFILKYTDSCYKQVLEANQKERVELVGYLNDQPELKEPDFLQKLLAAIELGKKDPSKQTNLLLEFCRYRLNKKIPSYLPFEERKQLFIRSPEWNGKIRQQNNHLKEGELTEDNIQAEIDSAATLSAFEIQQRFGKTKFFKAFNEGYCELVLDKGNVKYMK